MNESKPWYQSTGLLSGAVTSVVGLLTAVGLVSNNQAAVLAEHIPVLVVSGTAFIGGALSAWGRWRATTTITK